MTTSNIKTIRQVEIIRMRNVKFLSTVYIFTRELEEEKE
jgi:hypothetical protein